MPFLSKLLVALCLFAAIASAQHSAQPNVILIITDDQGYGDFGIMGNEVLNTPHFDQLARESATMTEFYVSPVCSPTRANLMTGRYNYRTRVVDTWKGRSMMDPEEYTIAEALRDAGYTTGIFGKWHLGDNYPLRPSEQGFAESYIHRGGGLAQPSEPIENKRRYTNPILFHNNQKIETRGYCTDLYFEAAARFIDKSLQQQKPFFAYIATNAPHSPYHDVPEALYQKYLTKDLESIMVDDKTSRDNLARIFAMIENVDENIGRLMDQLQRRDIARDTIVIFLNDNGPNSRRFVGPYRGNKGEVHDGGVRSPFWVRWPARIEPGTTSDRVSAHYDVMPTILAATQASVPAEVALDGRNLLPLLEGKSVAWPDRDIFLQSHRGDEPIAEHHMMVRSQKWKLTRPSGFHNETPDSDVPFELYDMETDPGETQNLVHTRKDIFDAMRQRYHVWFYDVSSTRPNNYAPPRMRIGDEKNSELTLSWQDRRDIASGYEWHVQIDRAGDYGIELQWAEPSKAKEVHLTLGNQRVVAKIPAGATTYSTKILSLPSGPLNLQVTVIPDKGRDAPPYFVILTQR